MFLDVVTKISQVSHPSSLSYCPHSPRNTSRLFASLGMRAYYRLIDNNLKSRLVLFWLFSRFSAEKWYGERSITYMDPCLVFWASSTPLEESTAGVAWEGVVLRREGGLLKVKNVDVLSGIASDAYRRKLNIFYFLVNGDPIIINNVLQ